MSEVICIDTSRRRIVLEWTRNWRCEGVNFVSSRRAGMDKPSLLIVNLRVNLCPIYWPLSRFSYILNILAISNCLGIVIFIIRVTYNEGLYIYYNIKRSIWNWWILAIWLVKTNRKAPAKKKATISKILPLIGCKCIYQLRVQIYIDHASPPKCPPQLPSPLPSLLSQSVHWRTHFGTILSLFPLLTFSCMLCT